MTNCNLTSHRVYANAVNKVLNSSFIARDSCRKLKLFLPSYCRLEAIFHLDNTVENITILLRYHLSFTFFEEAHNSEFCLPALQRDKCHSCSRLPAGPAPLPIALSRLCGVPCSSPALTFLWTISEQIPLAKSVKKLAHIFCIVTGAGYVWFWVTPEVREGQHVGQSQHKGSRGSARQEDRNGTALLDGTDLLVQLQLLMWNAMREASAAWLNPKKCFCDGVLCVHPKETEES